MGFTLRWPGHHDPADRRRRKGTLADRGAGLTTRVTPIGEAMPLIERELRRARRYEHPLGILLLTLADGFTPDAERCQELSGRTGNGRRGHPHEGSGAAATALGGLLSGAIRETDILTAPEDERYFLLALPETDREAMTRAAHRITQDFLVTGNARLRIGMAEFPSQGLTLDELFDRARKEWLMSPVSLDRPSDQEEAAHA